MGSTIVITVGAISGAIISALVCVTYVSWVTIPNAREDERAIVLGQARERAMELIDKRRKDDAEISTFDQRQLCVELGGEWVQSDIENPCH